MASGESKRQVGEDSGIPRSTLTGLYNDAECRKVHLDSEYNDDRVEAAIDDFGSLPALDIEQDAGEIHGAEWRPLATEL